MMPADGMKTLADFDAIFRRCGLPGYRTISLWDLLLTIRKGFDQYINLRPIKFKGAPCPLIGKSEKDIDMIVVRENCEGEYGSRRLAL